MASKKNPKKDSKNEWYEQAAKEENEYVRAVILKPNHPAKDEALEIATRARDMAKSALGKDHPSYAEAIQNLGLYHAIIENNDNKANEFFDEARAVVGQYHPVLSRTFYFLALYYEQAVGDIAKAEHFCNETLAIVRREGYPNDPRIAQILEKLAQLKSAPQSHRQSPAKKSAGTKAKSGRRSPI